MFSGYFSSVSCSSPGRPPAGGFKSSSLTETAAFLAIKLDQNLRLELNTSKIVLAKKTNPNIEFSCKLEMVHQNIFFDSRWNDTSLSFMYTMCKTYVGLIYPRISRSPRLLPFNLLCSFSFGKSDKTNSHRFPSSKTHNSDFVNLRHS